MANESGGLEGQISRHVRMRAYGWLSLALIWVLFLSLPAILTSMEFRRVQLSRHLIQRGISVDGDILYDYVHSSGRGQSYHVVFEYKKKNTISGWGEDLRGDSRVSAGDYTKLNSGSRVVVTYDPLDPENVGLKQYDLDRNANIIFNFITLYGLLMLSYFISSLIFVVFISVLFLNRYRLMRDGILVDAQIISEKIVTGRSGKGRSVTFSFVAQPGQSIIFKSQYMPLVPSVVKNMRDMELCLAHSHPFVLYDPKKPTRAFLYPDEYFSCPDLSGEVKRRIEEATPASA
jgi:hypothetical protein